MNDFFAYPDGATPLDLDEIQGLIPTHVVNRHQLNELEQYNISQAELWLVTARFKKINSEANLCKLHSKMFSQVWKWAGKFRQSGKNIGVEAYQIGLNLKNLCDDVDAWIEFKSYPVDEIAVHFHHRLVYIHPFPNGNGRHARLATDILLSKQLKEKRFTWGRKSLENADDTRKQYIVALQEADKGSYTALKAFVRS